MNRPSEWSTAAPLVIAHRGASAVAPENTLPAFERAVALGADAIELDAKLTRDGIPVAFHDRLLVRTTGAPGCVGDRTFQELQRMDAGAWKGAEHTGAQVPGVEAVLEAVARSVLVNIELTDYWSDQERLVLRVVEIVRRLGLAHRVLFSSFQSAALRAAHREAPEMARARLSGPTWLSYRDRIPQRRAPIDAIHPHESQVTPSLLGWARDRGYRTHIFTVDEAERMERFWAWGADGLITDVPDVARTTRERAWTR
jgi:glycerophosphoryl diester phosphodiesterase